jgi:hypothetical protein
MDCVSAGERTDDDARVRVGRNKGARESQEARSGVRRSVDGIRRSTRSHLRRSGSFGERATRVDRRTILLSNVFWLLASQSDNRGRELSAPEKRRRLSGETMKKTVRTPRREIDHVRPEYQFDYSQAKPNRFASRMSRPVIAVVLEPDIAAVFDSSAKVNAQLRSAIVTRKPRKQATRSRTRHRRAS